MEKQFCKVGSVTPIEGTGNPIQILQWQYKNFLKKSKNGQVDAKLLEFFEQKAEKVKKALEALPA